MAVGIERRKEEKNYVIERAGDFRIVRGGEGVQQFRRGLRGRDFRGVNAHAERHDHRLALGDGARRRFVERPRVGEAERVGANLLEPREVGRR
jgi:hypothetical protein